MDARHSSPPTVAPSGVPLGRMPLACLLLSPFLAKAAASVSVECPVCRRRMRCLELSHCRDRRGPYGIAARLASSPRRARAITGVPGHRPCTLRAGWADTAPTRGANGQSADTAPLEMAHAIVRHAGVPGHGLATHGDPRVSCCLPPRIRTAEAPTALARAVTAWAPWWGYYHDRGQT